MAFTRAMRAVFTYFQRHWRGQLSVGLVLFNLLGVSGGLRLWPWHSVVPLLVVALGVSVWQGVGAIRFGERVLRDGGTTRAWAAYGALVVAILLNASLAASVALPKPPVDLTIKGLVPKTEVLGDVIRVFGDIDYHSLIDLEADLAAHPQIQTIVLSSFGGNPIAGRSIGLLLARKGLNTRVEDVCFSACILAFAGGAQRVLAEGGALGFHGYRFDMANRVQTFDAREIEQKDVVFLESRGFSVEFVARIFATSPDRLWRPDRDVLRAAGVLRGP